MSSPLNRELWARLWPLCHFLEGQSYSAAVKTACRLVGDTTGPVRAPLLPLEEGPTLELRALLELATLGRTAAQGAELLSVVGPGRRNQSGSAGLMTTGPFAVATSTVRARSVTCALYRPSRRVQNMPK